MIPENLEVDAVELSGRLSASEALLWLEKAGERPVVRSSDAHTLKDISQTRATTALLEEPSFYELGLALKGIDGRRVLWPWGQDNS